jgi:transcriptional regulator with XRE-family HTH domain
MSAKADKAIRNARDLFKNADMTLEEFGKAMGLDEKVARKGAWQFLNKVTDPKISTLRRVAKALGVEVRDLV